MSIFDIKKVGGGIFDAIRCDEPNYLIWKWHPDGTTAGNNQKENAIRWGSSLRVKEGSIAIFVYKQKDGPMYDVIEGPFDKKIETANLPAISNLLGLAFDGGTPFQAEIYFINLAGIIHTKFAVPYFPVTDSRFPDLAVPVAVRGSFNFSIKDYKEFIRLHRLDSFSVEDFEKQIKDAIIKYVKGAVNKVPSENSISLVQIENKIEEISDIIESKVKARMSDEFAVYVSSLDISVIEIDKTSESYQQFKQVTADIAMQEAKVAASEKRKNIKAQNRLERFMNATNAVVDKEEETYAKHKKTKDSTSLKKVIVGSLADKLHGKNKENGAGSIPPPIPKAFYVASNGQPIGPFDVQTLSEMKSSGKLTKETLVWKEGMDDWVKAESVNELKSLFTVIPPIPNSDNS